MDEYSYECGVIAERTDILEYLLKVSQDYAKSLYRVKTNEDAHALVERIIGDIACNVHYAHKRGIASNGVRKVSNDRAYIDPPACDDCGAVLCHDEIARSLCRACEARKHATKLIVRVIRGKKCVPAWHFENGAFQHNGKWWRVLQNT